MQIHVEMNYSEYFEANRLLLLHTTATRKWNFISAWYFCPVMAVILMILVVVIWASTGHFSLTLFWCIFMAAVCAWSRIGFARRVRSTFLQQQKHLDGTMRLDESGLDYDRSDVTANAHLSWAAFDSWLETPESFLLFALCSVTRIPKKDLSQVDEVELREWITKEVKPAK